MKFPLNAPTPCILGGALILTHFGCAQAQPAPTLLAQAATDQPKLTKAQLAQPRHFNDTTPLVINPGLDLDIHRPYDLPGIAQVQGKKTGFFHTEQIGGKWWLIDPNGQGYWMKSIIGFDFDKFGWSGVSNGTKKRFGTPQNYVKWGSDLLKDAGFTAVTQGGEQPLAGPLPMVRQLSHRGFHGWRANGNMEFKISEGPDWHDLSNPFHPRFPQWCEREAQLQVAPFKNSPWLIGWELGNETDWYSEEMASRVMSFEPSHYGKIAMVELAKQEFGTIAKFNAAWRSEFASFDALLANQKTVAAPSTEAARAFSWKFADLTTEKFFSIWAGAIRKADPNHLILGIRQHNHQNQNEFNRGFWRIMGKYCDVITVNAYAGSVPVDPVKGVPVSADKHFSEISELSGRPLINSEWFPNVAPAPVYRKYQSWMMAHPDFVGSELFRLRGGGELTFTDGDYQPNPDLLAAAKEVNFNVADLRLKTEPLQFSFVAPGAHEWKAQLPARQNGRLPATVKNGPMAFEKINDGWKITYNGQPFGRLEPMVSQKFDGQSRYIRATKHEVLAWYENDDWIVVDSRLTNPGTGPQGVDAGGGKPPAKGQKIAYGYAATQRMWLPKAMPGAYVTQFLGIKNLSMGDWTLSSYYHEFETELGGNGKDDEVQLIKSLYNFSSWKDEKAGLAWGVFSPDKRMGGRAIIYGGNGPQAGRRASTVAEGISARLVGAQAFNNDNVAAVVQFAYDPKIGLPELQGRVEKMVAMWTEENAKPEYKSRFAAYD